MIKFLCACVLAVITLPVLAGNFTPNNIVVVRVGDGNGTLSNASQPVFLDEYSTTTGQLVQSVALPTAVNGNNHILTLSGSATSEGSLTLSANNQYLVLAGYDAAPGLVSVASDTVTNRTIGRIDVTGSVNTTTGFNFGSAYKKNNIRGACSNDGTGFWAAGNGSSNTGGTWYIPFGSFTSSATQVSTDVTNSRTINIFNGQLYTSSAAGGFYGVSSIGTGLPTTSGETTTLLPGMPTSSGPSDYAFWFLDEDPNTPGVDVLYMVDDRTTSPDGGVYKYSLVSGTWVSNGNIPNADGLRGIVAGRNCTFTSIGLTSETGVYIMRDSSGYNQTIQGTITQVAIAGANTKIRGIAFTPGTVPPSTLQASVGSATDVTCNGAANGAITLSVSGGVTPYTYSWNGGSTSQNRTNLSPGTYNVTVSDLSGCSATASATISQPSQLTASASKTDATCNGATNGSITLTVGGGTTNYTYHWNDNNTSQNRNNIAAGNYTVTVTDAHNCTVTASANVTQPTAIVVTANITNLPCTGGGNTGAVDITVSGGNPSYTYAWSNSATTQDINNLGAGTYTVSVTDNSSCSVTFSATVSQSGTLQITPSSTAVSCHGGNNGAINITVSGGTPAYSYAWSNSATTQNLSNLAAGSYTVTVNDNAGCSLTSNVSITEPTVITASANTGSPACYGGNTGSIDLTSSGGTPGYQYSWSNGGQTATINSLGAGAYTVTITDAHNCTATASYSLFQPDSIALSGTVSNATSFGASNGSVTLTVSGGTPNYTYSWSNSSSNQNLTAVAAGNYCVTVTDNNSCTAASCYTISQPSGISDEEVVSYINVYVTGNELNLQAQLKSESPVQIRLINLSGQVLATQQISSGSVITCKIPTDNLASGYYVLQMHTNSGTICRKLVVNR